MIRGLVTWLVDHATTMIVAILGVFAFGLLSYVSLPRESAPDITIPVVIVSTPYIGVSPGDIENLVTIPLENELASVKGVKEMRSTSAEGVSIVVLEFEPDSVIEDALQRVRDRVNRVQPSLPDDAEDPTIREISFSDVPVVLITLAGNDEQQLKRLAEDLDDRISRVPGVLDVKITGGTERQIRVQVMPERLAHYGLAMHDVSNALRDENVNVPGGNVEVGRGNFMLRVPGEFVTPADIETVAIKRVGDRPVFVRDVARVVDSFKDRETYSRMAGSPSVTLSVTKRAGANILDVARNAKAEAEDASRSWPAGVTWRALADQSENIELMVADLENSILLALILVVGVLLVFLGLRPSLFVALSIPLSMLVSFLVLDVLGFTLNMIVLFSLVLALGMLVDNGIVIVENVYRHKEMGKDRRTASIDGTTEVAIPVIASTLTTVAAFAPLVFWTGIMGKFMGFLPKTVIIVLTASLVVALTVLPVLTSRLMPSKVSAGWDLETGGLRDAQLGWMMSAYRAVLRASIRWRYASAAAGVVSLLATFVAYAALNHGTEFFPDTEPDRAVVGIRLPQGTGIDTTDRVARQVEEILRGQENVETWVADIGVSASGDALSGTSSAPNEGRISVDFLPNATNARRGEKLRVEPTPVTVDRIRDLVAEIPGAKVTVEPERMGPPVGKPINVEISGRDFDQVGEVALRLRRTLEALDGVTDLEDDYRVGRPELQLRIDRGAAKRIGVSTNAVGGAVRTAIAGQVATTLRDGEDEYDILVELAPEYREDLQRVLDLRLPGREDTSPDTFPVPISAVATYELIGGSGGIKHIDQRLVVTIAGDVAEGFNENEVREAVKGALADFDWPDGVSAALTGADQEQQEAMSFLVRAFFIAVALIALVMVTQFDSLAVPLIILGTVVLSLIGVLWGLVLTGTPFGVIMTGIGVISLAGVVVNNAIVLLDYVQQLTARGVEVGDALVEAGLTRFRPVMLTAVTTVLGLVPMALGISVDFFQLKITTGGTSGQWWGPMAVAVIFGLSFATILTLVMVPTLFSIYDDLRRLPDRVRSAFGRRAAAGTAALLLAAALGAPSPAAALTLQEAWEAAEENDLSLRIAQEQAIQAGTMRGKAWSALSPRVVGTASYVINNQEIAFGIADSLPPELSAFLDPNDLPPPTVIQEKTFWQGDVTVSQRLFSGSALPALRAAYALNDAAQEDLRAERARSRSRVAAAYYGLMTAEQGVQVAEMGVALAQAQLTLAERQVEAGLAVRRALLQAQLGLSQAERDLDGAREQLLDARSGFTLLTGLDPVGLELPEPVAVPADPEAAVSEARVRRPDLVAAGHRADALRRQRTAQDLRWLPVVDAIGSYNYTQNPGFNDRNWTWRVVLQGQWTFWDGGLRIAERRETASQYRAAELAEELVLRQAEREVRVAWESHRRAEAALQAVERERALAEESLALAEASYAGGGATWLEVEQARLQVQATALSQLRERMVRDLAAIDLLARTGAL